MDPSLKFFFDSQLESWELARNNFRNLANIKKRHFDIKGLDYFVQYNPARGGSTLAKTDKESIKKRGCFLCRSNRPKEQLSLDLLPDWELLVNPFPILPFHFTIVNKNHIPQKLSLATGKQMAAKLGGMVVFYNDDGAGASAPDHFHYQAVPAGELPLINYLDKNWKNEENVSKSLVKIVKEEEIEDSGFPLNVFFWMPSGSNDVRVIGIPRKSHRPKEFYLDPPERRAISPGAIDMAGILITPFEEDFLNMRDSDIKSIYNQVAFINE